MTSLQRSECLSVRRTIVLAGILFFLTAVSSPLRAASEPAQKYPPTIVFMTDFGVIDDAVAICHGVMYSVMPTVRVTDLTHEVTPFSILDGARFLEGVTPYYPAGTVFVVVIDPGVGSTRKAIVARSKRGQYFVLPDNGLLTLVEQSDGIEAVREITNTDWMTGTKLSSTFHGRDIFSPAAAHLASGEDWTLAGPAVTDLVKLSPRIATIEPKGITGDVIGLDDPYGSLITDIQGSDFKNLGYELGDKVAFKIAAKQFTFPYVKTFMGVPVGQPLVYIDSRGRVGIAVNQGDFSKKYAVSPPVPVFIPRKGAGR